MKRSNSYLIVSESYDTGTLYITDKKPVTGVLGIHYAEELLRGFGSIISRDVGDAIE